jgi:hypothetical protein
MSVVQDQIKELEEEGQISCEEFKCYRVHFYETCIEYIQEQCVLFLAPLQSMDCIRLKKVPDWNNIVSLKLLLQISLWLKKNCLTNFLV